MNGQMTPSDSTAGSPAPQSGSGQTTGTAVRILVVEDELVVAMDIHQSLRAYGYQVLEPTVSANEAHPARRGRLRPQALRGLRAVGGDRGGDPRLPEADAGPGAGLGLYISKGLVELMGGRIDCEGKGAGRGATFFFSLPIAPADGS